MKNSLLILALFAALVATSFWFASPGLPNINSADRTDAQVAEPTHALADLSTGTVHYHLEGPEHAPTIMLMNGFKTPSFVWNDHISPLIGEGFRVLSFDNYDLKPSDGPTDTDMVEQTDNLMVELLAHLNITRPVHLVGTSTGAPPAALFAANHPTKVRSLTLIAAMGENVKTALARIENLPVQVVQSERSEITPQLISFIQENRMAQTPGGVGGKARGPEARLEPADCLCHGEEAPL